jgi:hypothetical protein
MATKKEQKPRKLKVGSTIPVEIKCAITGGDITVYVPVEQTMDTDFQFRWRAKKWYEGLTDKERQDIADEIRRRENYWNNKNTKA